MVVMSTADGTAAAATAASVILFLFPRSDFFDLLTDVSYGGFERDESY